MSKTKLKNLIIIGYDPSNRALKSASSHYAYKAEGTNGNLKIGNGMEALDLNQIANLKDHYDISSSTRIDIHAHGINLDGVHYITLFENSRVPTSALLTILNQQFDNKPIQVHLWSCFGGNAAKEVDKLAPGSCIIAHGPKDKELAESNAFNESFSHRDTFITNAENGYLDYEEIIHSLNIGSEQNCYVGINNSSAQDSKVVIEYKANIRSMLEGNLVDDLNNFRSKVFNVLKTLAIKDIHVPNMMPVNTLDDYSLNSYINQSFETKFIGSDSELLNLLNEKSDVDLLDSLSSKFKSGLPLYLYGHFQEKVIDKDSYVKSITALCNNNRIFDECFINKYSKTNLLQNIIDRFNNFSIDSAANNNILSEVICGLINNYDSESIQRIFTHLDYKNTTAFEMLFIPKHIKMTIDILHKAYEHGVKLSSLVNTFTGKNILHTLAKEGWSNNIDDKKLAIDFVNNYIKSADSEEIRDLFLHQDQNGNNTILTSLLNNNAYIFNGFYKILSDKVDIFTETLNQGNKGGLTALKMNQIISQENIVQTQKDIAEYANLDHNHSYDVEQPHISDSIHFQNNEMNLLG